MKRLTRRELSDSMGRQIVLCDHKESDCNDSCMYRRCKWNEKALKKLKEYEDLEEQGLILRLPCKLGSTLYDITEFVEGCKYPEIYVVDASKIEISKDEKGFLYCIDGVDLRDKHFGTVLFESAEEAEQALAKMKDV